MQKEYDYIIIGAGSAGSTLAYRLGEDTGTQILVIEAGPMDHNLFIHMPSGFAYPWPTRVTPGCTSPSPSHS